MTALITCDFKVTAIVLELLLLRTERSSALPTSAEALTAQGERSDRGAGDPQATAATVEAAATAMAAAGMGPMAGVGAAMAQQLRVEAETLTTFRNRVNDLLARLEKSKAAPHRIADGTLPTGRLGNFDEAHALHGAYTRVHAQLENLSKMLALQIEGLMTAVDASKSNYHDLDSGVRDRLQRIHVQADKLAAKQARSGASGHIGGGAHGAGNDTHGTSLDSQAGGKRPRSGG